MTGIPPFSSQAQSQLITVAAAHASAPLFDRQRSVDKAIEIIAEAARSGVQLLVFPESFIPGFPVWAGLYRPIDAHRFFRRFAESALFFDGEEMQSIQKAAEKHRIFVSLGFNEASRSSPGCMWNSQALISDTGELLNLHRKLVPTFYEQLTWNRGDAAGLKVVQTSIGRIGSLICGENNNPLARYVLMSEGEQIHCSCYPAVWPFRNPLSSAPYDLKDAIRFRAAAHSFEAKVYTIVAAGVLDDESVAAVSEGDEEIAAILLASPRACSMIVGPTGELVSEVRQDAEGLVLSQIDLSQLVEFKQHHDMAGYYNRHELFQLSLRRDRPNLIDTSIATAPCRSTESDASVKRPYVLNGGGNDEHEWQ
ncbi:carbon-nitrogen hydrolase family protein [Paraburkholderia caribensis]|uniref:carbon-nitrogen hydrolase family protein n=1 Tax=Paraburkholderia TaxID=1822464 RepID=UPI001CB19D15|nr:carbon-nitrogen hydrolase family protein [Paraburkholderia caribensis]BEU25637.1 carbon-nitrogen hydrolase family protein [Paraburkholderia sp. 22B1P]CAG9262453.1 Aliphatic nitrilase [Paraburkholderia caribensis]